MWFFTQQGILAQQLRNNSAYIESIVGIATIKIKKKEYNLAFKDLNRAEALAKYYNINQFNVQIRSSKAAILDKQLSK